MFLYRQSLKALFTPDKWKISPQIHPFLQNKLFLYTACNTLFIKTYRTSRYFGIFKLEKQTCKKADGWTNSKQDKILNDYQQMLTYEGVTFCFYNYNKILNMLNTTLGLEKSLYLRWSCFLKRNPQNSFSWGYDGLLCLACDCFLNSVGNPVVTIKCFACSAVREGSSFYNVER